MSMNPKSRSRAFATTYILPVAALAFAIGIFDIDTFTPLEGAIAVLYVVIVLIAANYLERRGILLVSLGCVVLTVLSYVLSHGFTTSHSFIRLLVSLAAIGITTFLALKVRQQEEELQVTIDTIPTLAWHARPDGSAEYVNRRWLDYTGLSLDHALGWDWKVAVHPEDFAKLENARRAILASGQPGELEARLRRFDGEYRWFLSRYEPLRDKHGNIVRWYGTNTDIEDMKRAEDALRRSETYSAEAQRLSLTGSFGWKVAKEEIVWSEETYRIFDYDRAVRPTIELVLQRVHPDDVELVRQTIDRAAQGAPELDVQHRLRMPDGSIKHVHVLARLIARPTDEACKLEYVGALRDVTAAKQAEGALHEAQVELAHVTRMTTLGQLTASIAHEVNQPLTGVVMNGAACLRWLGREPPVLDEVRTSVEAMISDAQRASEVIERIRALARKTNPEKAPLDINGVIHDVIRLVQREMLSHRVSLRLELAPALPQVLGDRVQLQQVIINLVINSVQAMESVTNRPRRLLIRSQQDKADHVLVEVHDSGPGFDTESASGLFDAFFTTKPGGMGMGLSICRSIIDAHGGRVWASGRAGQGAIFRFTLPLSRKDAA
jgi:PAS domain S-box-containing protein